MGGDPNRGGMLMVYPQSEVVMTPIYTPIYNSDDSPNFNVEAITYGCCFLGEGGLKLKISPNMHIISSLFVCSGNPIVSDLRIRLS